MKQSRERTSIGVNYRSNTPFLQDMCLLGGDHSIGYPDIRGTAPYIDGNIGIIHFDRHSDLSEKTYDIADITALLGSRVIIDILATLLEADKLGQST
ncbi:MAG TPA: arginase family protein [Ktedonobacteraceae bacterium]|nr:arginase family protein [Ktedonobacteraceae bacterium]